MRLALLLAALVALATAQRRVAPQYKVRDEGATRSEGARPHIPAPIYHQAAAPKQEETGFVHPIDFSGLLRESVLGAEATDGVPSFGGAGPGGPLHAAPAVAPAVFRPTEHEFQPFGAEQQKAAAEEGRGFVEPAVKFRSLFDSGAASGGGFRMQDFLAAHASSQKEVEERVHAAAEGRDDDEGEGRVGGRRVSKEGEGRRRAAATELRVRHDGEEEEEAAADEAPRGGPNHRYSYSADEDGERGPAQFGPSPSPPYAPAASSPEERHRADRPYLGPDYSKIAYEAEGEGEEEEEGAGTAPEKTAAAAKQRGKNCKKVAKKVTAEDVGKGRFRRAVKPAMTCYVCDDPENGGSYESCAYGSSPKDKSYFMSRAYSSKGKGNKYRQRRYLPDGPIDPFASSTNAQESEDKVPEYEKAASGDGDAGKLAYEAVPGDSYDENFRRLFPEFTYREASASSPAVASASALKEDEEEEADEKEEGPGGQGAAAETEERATDYGYKGPPAEFFLDTAQKKHLEKLVGEFSQKDRTACKKVMKDQMTCFQCIDEKGVQHEECMFVAKSDPKGRHLAYHELKEYRLVPDGDAGGRGFAAVAASAAVPRLPLPGVSLDSSASPASLVNPLRVPAPSAAASENRKKVQAAGGGERESEEEEEREGERLTPAEAALADGVYADETSNAFDPVRKIHLPKYMLKKSEHEAIFEEFVKASHETEE